MHDFEDIRPYNDDEVSRVISSLLQDQEFTSAMAKFNQPGWYRFFPGILTHLAQKRLQAELKHVNNVHDVQIVIEKYLDDIIETTTTSVAQTGLEKLDRAKPYLFISNHRDITMDPALVNYMLYHEGFSTVQIAIGDNLLKRPFLSDLMRLNKSFIVKRSLQGREMLKASKQLSAYIHHCIQIEQNVWIAQREGRAKDGIDKTESAIIKMLYLAGREQVPKLSLSDTINRLNIVPVSISYELDPCDTFKAEELHAVATMGKFEKNENSDVQSILNGMIGNKGDIHVAFGEPLQVEDNTSAEGVAALLDKQIIANYKLQPINYLALQKTQEKFMDFSNMADIFNISEELLENKKSLLEERLKPLSKELQPYLLNMYANPVIRQIEQKN